MKEKEKKATAITEPPVPLKESVFDLLDGEFAQVNGGPELPGSTYFDCGHCGNSEAVEFGMDPSAGGFVMQCPRCGRVAEQRASAAQAS